ncbi:MAG: metal-dependent transcriptional regulator, partial [Methanomicrobiales archaeon]|nr:metal-dependent transcriptional regulator [Methanomicrobiales archaeon]
MLSSTFEDYLEAVFMITENGERSATLQEIATTLGTGEKDAGATALFLIGEGYL